jgi:hypothetical protein
VPSVMCNRLWCPNRTFSARARAPERLCRIELDGESNQQINRGHKFEVLLGAPEPTSYTDHGSICPIHFHSNYSAQSGAARIASNEKLSCARLLGDLLLRSPPTEWLNQFQRCWSAELMSSSGFSPRKSHLFALRYGTEVRKCALAVARYNSVSD